jgi:hypothetical protein
MAHGPSGGQAPWWDPVIPMATIGELVLFAVLSTAILGLAVVSVPLAR